MDHRSNDTLLDSVLGSIGNTPLVELSRITRGLKRRILAKLEYLNPGRLWSN
jgi:cysteine synthase